MTSTESFKCSVLRAVVCSYLLIAEEHRDNISVFELALTVFPCQALTKLPIQKCDVVLTGFETDRERGLSEMPHPSLCGYLNGLSVLDVLSELKWAFVKKTAFPDFEDFFCLHLKASNFSLNQTTTVCLNSYLKIGSLAFLWLVPFLTATDLFLKVLIWGFLLRLGWVNCTVQSPLKPHQSVS